jgi:hypothetical protein
MLVKRLFKKADSASTEGKRKALVICTHLRRQRTKERSSHFLQPITGLHIGSFIDTEKYAVCLYHEDWHGPFDTANDAGHYDLVFLTGLQADFDRMRQLSYHFQHRGAAVIAGGSICTLFPGFAAQFFTSVCAGGVDAVRDAIRDFEKGTLKPVYSSTTYEISRYDVDYSLFARAGISPATHLIEASRGCSFRCSFCVIPAEGAKHASYQLEAVGRAIDDAIKSSPRLSFRRFYPTIFFLDNNFTDNRQKALAVAELLYRDKRIRAWGALVTQDVLHDRDLILKLYQSKCRMLFVGLESLDREFLRRYNKKQNLSRRGDIVADIVYAESLGMCLGYGYLFDPRAMTAAEMEAQVRTLAATPGFPMPTFLSLISPLAGTASFWEDARGGELAPNLLLRDLDGETIAFSKLADEKEALAAFVEKMSRRPWMLTDRWSVIRSIFQRMRNSGRIDLLRWYIILSGSLYPYALGRKVKSPRKAFFAGEDDLDPQYEEYPMDISSEDWERYFEPIPLTRPDGRLAEWLLPYMQRRKPDKANQEVDASAG